MFRFGRKSARPAARPALARGFVQGMAGREWGQAGTGAAFAAASYETQVREAYAANPVAQRAVRLVAESVGQAPMACNDSDAAALIAAKSDGQDLVETVAAHLLLHGNAYVQIIAGDSGAPVELFALRPERVTIEADARGWPAAYVYRAGDNVLRLDPGGPQPEIVHLKAFHPLDDHRGLGCLGAAAGAVAIHNAATRWNKALLDNAARPSGALIHDPGEGMPLSADQIARLRDELDQLFQGAGNAGRPLLLEGGLKWQALSLTPADMDFVELKAVAAREIALAFGVPPMLLGLPGDATYANYREANRALWRLTILPLAAKILTGLAQALRPWRPELALAVDVDRVPELAEERERLWAMLGSADFLTASEKRAMIGLAPRGRG